jgi:sugar/nucleoside kinase (ribokinase family)
MAGTFLALGNIDRTKNITKFGEETVYGGGTYSAISALKLDYNAAVLTRGNEALHQWIKNLEKMGIEVFLEQDESTLEVINDHSSGKWIQKILSTAGKINFDIDRKFDIIHANPLFKEIDQQVLSKARKKAKLLSLDIQGIMRNERNGIMFLKELEKREEWLKGIDIVHVSDSESMYVTKETEPENICNDIQSAGPKIVLYTLGAKGSFILGKHFHNIPSFPVKEIDPTGAGDVYSATFDIIYLETGDERKAAFFASAAASFCVEDFGYKNIQSREKVEERSKELMDKEV